jgi:hypothetical protein
MLGVTTIGSLADWDSRSLDTETELLPADGTPWRWWVYGGGNDQERPQQAANQFRYDGVQLIIILSSRQNNDGLRRTEQKRGQAH